MWMPRRLIFQKGLSWYVRPTPQASFTLISIQPTHESTKPEIEKPLDDNFWNDSEAEDIDFDDFDDDAANGSESDQELNNDSEDDEVYDDDDDDEDTERVKGKARDDRLDSDMTEPDE